MRGGWEMMVVVDIKDLSSHWDTHTDIERERDVVVEWNEWNEMLHGTREGTYQSNL